MVKVDDCVPGKYYRCLESGKIVQCLMNTVFERGGVGVVVNEYKVFRYWNTRTETFMHMDVIDGQLKETLTHRSGRGEQWDPK